MLCSHVLVTKGRERRILNKEWQDRKCSERGREWLIYIIAMIVNDSNADTTFVTTTTTTTTINNNNNGNNRNKPQLTKANYNKFWHNISKVTIRA